MDERLIEEIAEHIRADLRRDYPHLLPYDALPEPMRVSARATARAALTGIERAGYRLIKDAGVRSYPAT